MVWKVVRDQLKRDRLDPALHKFFPVGVKNILREETFFGVPLAWGITFLSVALRVENCHNFALRGSCWTENCIRQSLPVSSILASYLMFASSSDGFLEYVEQHMFGISVNASYFLVQQFAREQSPRTSELLPRLFAAHRRDKAYAIVNNTTRPPMTPIVMPIFVLVVVVLGDSSTAIDTCCSLYATERKAGDSLPAKSEYTSPRMNGKV